MEKIIQVVVENNEIQKIEKLHVPYKCERYNVVHNILGRKMTDEKPVECLYNQEYDDDYIIYYTVKLGIFSDDLKELYGNFNSMKELFDYMSDYSLVENNDVIYTAYIEQKWVIE